MVIQISRETFIPLTSILQFYMGDQGRGSSYVMTLDGTKHFIPKDFEVNVHNQLRGLLPKMD